LTYRYKDEVDKENGGKVKRGKFFWEVTLMMKKILLVLNLILVTNINLSLIVAVIIVLANLIAQILNDPFPSAKLNYIAMFLDFAILAVLLDNIYFYNVGGTFLALDLIMLIFAGVIVGCAVILWAKEYLTNLIK